LELLRGLPADFPVPILLVIHMSPPLASALAEWLDQQSPLRVGYALDGEPMPPPGEARVPMAPPDRHLIVQRGRLWLIAEPERHACRPSVDVLFESIAAAFGEQAIACLLTGMGRDGAAGLLAVRSRGGMTLAQDEASSVVFGMPREAIALGAALQVLPLVDIAPVLKSLAGRK
jgi:two-component system chemotaxis response regulator CheB